MSWYPVYDYAYTDGSDCDHLSRAPPGVAYSSCVYDNPQLHPTGGAPSYVAGFGFVGDGAVP